MSDLSLPHVRDEISSLQMFSKELCQLAYRLFHVLRHPIRRDVSCAGDAIQLLVVRPRGSAGTLFSHIVRIGIAARHHQEWLVDEAHLLAGLKRHRIH